MNIYKLEISSKSYFLFLPMQGICGLKCPEIRLTRIEKLTARNGRICCFEAISNFWIYFLRGEALKYGSCVYRSSETEHLDSQLSQHLPGMITGTSLTSLNLFLQL